MQIMITKKGKHEFFRDFLPLVLGIRRKATAILALGVLSLASSSPVGAQTYTVLHSFDSTDGSYPWAGLVQATDGNLYGTTLSGGANGGCYADYGCGTLFKITPSGKLETVYNFCSQAGCTDGSNPEFGPLVQASDGNLYGTTAFGGAHGDGTVFKITPSGTLTTLYSFCSQSGCTDGTDPDAGLVQASDGNFYGTADQGGANGPDGTIFKITPSGILTTLHSFCSLQGCADGTLPTSALVQGTDGNLYGVAAEGGANNDGTVFKITTSGAFTRLHSFDGTDGAFPDGTLIQATDGNFYGTTNGGGANGVGTVYKITQGGTLTTLHIFDFATEGGYTEAGVVQGTDGNFYGITGEGGSTGLGAIFEITPGGTFTLVYNLCSEESCADGGGSLASLIQDTNGNFYGSTRIGGASNDGVVFSLSIGLGRFVETQTTSGKVGATVKILGTGLTGATSVTFNGTAAVFKVILPSVISATVPGGATSGEVEVTTPLGTLKSNVPFRVRL